MKFILLIGVAGVVALYWQGSKAAPPGSDIGTVLQAGVASISWPVPHGAGKKPCCSGCAGAAGGGVASAPGGAPQQIELVAS